MRNIYSIFIILLLSMAFGISAFAQQRTVRFTGRDRTNRYRVKLDRVEIFNLDQLWQEVIYWPDTTLMMGAVGIEDYENQANVQLLRNVPNPFDGRTEFALVLPEARDVRLELFDMTGKFVVGEDYSALPAGTHLFEATLMSPQTYLLSATVKDGRMTLKMINEGQGGANAIRYMGMTGSDGDFTVFLKNDRAMGSYPFTLGDRMNYIGYADIDGIVHTSDTVNQKQYLNETVPLFFDVTAPTVQTISIDSFDAYNAYLRSSVLEDGGSIVTTRGVCWDTIHDPTIYDGRATDDGSGLGNFSSTMAGLTRGTTYYVRAYATNSVGTAYGDELSFTTHTYPTVITYQPSNITPTSATFGGKVISNGGDWVTASGVCWSTNPYFGNETCFSSNSIGEFNRDITGLTPNTTYYVRAYATNGVGTAYGDTVVFTTLCDNPTGDTVAVVCNSFIWHGVEYTSTPNVAPTHTYQTVYGCDSIVTLHLTVTPTYNVTDARTICASELPYTWNGKTFTSAGTQSATLHTVNGCDSVVAMTLTVNHPQHHSYTLTAYDSYTWTEGNGQTYTVSGTYLYSHADANGCTQVDTLHLTVCYLFRPI